MISNRSVPTDTVLPHILYRDLAEAIAWLSNAFGFVEHYRYGDPHSGAQMSIGKAWLMLKRAKHEDAIPKSLGFGTQSLTVFIEDIEPHFQRAKTAGVTIVEDLHETVYGELQYGAEDLDGHHWLFSRHDRDLSPDQWGAAVSHAAVLTPQISPMLAVGDANAAIEFYKSGFRCECALAHGRQRARCRWSFGLRRPILSCHGVAFLRHAGSRSRRVHNRQNRTLRGESGSCATEGAGRGCCFRKSRDGAHARYDWPAAYPTLTARVRAHVAYRKDSGVTQETAAAPVTGGIEAEPAHKQRL